jgi:hypothetical protein
MQHNIIELVRKSRWAPRETEREVVAAISSAQGSADDLVRDSRRRAIGIALPLLALAAGVALGYSGFRWLQPSPRRRLPPEVWQRFADAARPILEAGKSRMRTWS